MSVKCWRLHSCHLAFKHYCKVYYINISLAIFLNTIHNLMREHLYRGHVLLLQSNFPNVDSWLEANLKFEHAMAASSRKDVNWNKKCGEDDKRGFWQRNRYGRTAVTNWDLEAFSRVILVRPSTLDPTARILVPKTLLERQEFLKCLVHFTVSPWVLILTVIHECYILLLFFSLIITVTYRRWWCWRHRLDSSNSTTEAN